MPQVFARPFGGGKKAETNAEKLDRLLNNNNYSDKTITKLNKKDNMLAIPFDFKAKKYDLSAYDKNKFDGNTSRTEIHTVLTEIENKTKRCEALQIEHRRRTKGLYQLLFCFIYMIPIIGCIIMNKCVHANSKKRLLLFNQTILDTLYKHQEFEKKHLQWKSLINGRVLVLLGEPKNNDIEQGEVLQYEQELVTDQDHVSKQDLKLIVEKIADPQDETGPILSTRSETSTVIVVK